MRQILNDFLRVNDNHLGLLALGWLLTLLLFHNFPVLDYKVAALFCSDLAARACFDPDPLWLAKAFRQLFYWVPILAFLLVAADMAFGYVHDGWRDRKRFCQQMTVLGGFLLGTIVIVNLILKAHSGRPRPYETEDFGGDLPFMAAGDFSGACTSNCSFVSGEAAAAGWLLCIIPLLRGPFRTIIAAFLIDVSIATPLLRVAMGGHYLSDAILGWLIGAGAAGVVALALRWRERPMPSALDKAI